MKIIHITPSYKPAYVYGGPIVSVAKLCEALVNCKTQEVESLELQVEGGAQYVESLRQKIELKVYTTTANGKTELDVDIETPILADGVLVTYFKRWTKDHSHFSPGLLWGLRKVIRQAQHDNLIIHIHAWWNLVSVLSCLIAKWYKIPVVLSPRGMLTRYTLNNKSSISKKLLHRLIGLKLLKYCHVHVTSEQEIRDVLQIVQPKSNMVIANLVDVQKIVVKGEDRVSGNKYQVSSLEEQVAEESEKIVAEQKVNTSVFKLLFLSRIEEKKGLELLFDALATTEFDYYLTIAGTGDEDYVKSLKKKAKSLKLAERVEWIGQVSNDKKFSIMAHHDLLVLPSYNENFANVVIESLSVGTSVLLSEKVGLADYVEANKLGWICNLNPEDIAVKLSESYQHHSKRENIRVIAPVVIRKDFNDQLLVGKYLEFYESVLRLRSE
ncbi:XrtY-associated glycosyltransferase XYAG1 [Pedobacter sp. Leaf132]|uniref:XrtY-associated glycosyltransferase XYAG1 n=1 Tax=Pedobacter sp. Leaf132 TaxID=2876557 RepID=UPI001E59A6C9|nr:glycosyltransferase [Pedobacter sp. Leaf132]